MKCATAVQLLQTPNHEQALSLGCQDLVNLETCRFMKKNEEGKMQTRTCSCFLGARGGGGGHHVKSC